MTLVLGFQCEACGKLATVEKQSATVAGWAINQAVQKPTELPDGWLAVLTAGQPFELGVAQTFCGTVCLGVLVDRPAPRKVEPLEELWVNSETPQPAPLQDEDRGVAASPQRRRATVSKLTTADVLEIRRVAEDAAKHHQPVSRLYHELATQYGVTHQAVRNVVNRRNWAHITE